VFGVPRSGVAPDPIHAHTGFTLSSVFGEPRTFNTGIGDGEFKAPTLRNITKTAPYFHD
jgi:cytochrome c peroxidase